jgi:ABC-type nitrate/sulfonate/bicarbonate transport system permease component
MSVTAPAPTSTPLPVQPSPEPSRRGVRWTESRLQVLLIRLGSLVALLVIWELATRGVNRALIVPPTEIARAVYQLTVEEPILWQAAFTTGRAFLAGFALAIVVGVAVGLAMGRSKRLDEVLDPWVFFLYAVPSIALIPVFVIWFGIADLLRVVLVFFASVFPVIINTASGVKNVDQELVDVGRSFAANERQIMRTVVLPASVPFIFAGIRVAMSQALVGIIGAELLAVITGLGGLVIRYANTFQTARMYVPILAIIVIALILTETMRRLHRRFSRWESTVEERA